MRVIDQSVLQLIKQKYPPGTRVVLIEMHDPYTNLAPGAKGRVRDVDDVGTIHVNWDNGGSLGIVYGVDSCKKIDE